METVRILEEQEFPPEMPRVVQGTREWIKIDDVPKMSRVIAWSAQFQWGFGRATRRVMSDGELKRWQKEMPAGTNDRRPGPPPNAYRDPLDNL